MTELVIFVVVGAFSIVLALIFRDVYLRNAELRAEERMAKTGYYRWMGAKGLEARYGKKKSEEEEESPDLGAWVVELANMAGINPDVFFDDEMPNEFKTFIPAIKGFLESGGLEKLKGQMGSGEDSRFI